MLANIALKVGFTVLGIAGVSLGIGTGVTLTKRFVFKDQYPVENQKPIVRAIMDESAKVVVGTAATMIATTALKTVMSQSDKWAEFILAKREASKAVANAVTNAVDAVVDSADEVMEAAGDAMRTAMDAVTATPGVTVTAF